jgi:hypothetical protein
MWEIGIVGLRFLFSSHEVPAEPQIVGSPFLVRGQSIFESPGHKESPKIKLSRKETALFHPQTGVALIAGTSILCCLAHKPMGG